MFTASQSSPSHLHSPSGTSSRKQSHRTRDKTNRSRAGAEGTNETTGKISTGTFDMFKTDKKKESRKVCDSLLASEFGVGSGQWA